MKSSIIILSILYISIVVLANFTANVVITTQYITFALGTVFFGFIFTLRDLLHARAGRKTTLTVIVVTALVNATAVLFNMFDIRILFASIIAFFISEIIDTEVYQKLLAKTWNYRVLVSNLISIPVDTVIFTLLAFFGIWDANTLIVVIAWDIVIKYITAALLIVTNKQGASHG